MNELQDLFKRYTSTHNIELGNQQEAKNMKLIDHKEEELWTGTILRFKGKYPFEEIVDFMLVSIPWVESRFVFVCISGYHAGEIEFCFPNEAKVSTHSISRSWLLKNWNKRIYADCAIQDVHILEAQVPLGYE